MKFTVLAKEGIVTSTIINFEVTHTYLCLHAGNKPGSILSWAVCVSRHTQHALTLPPLPGFDWHREEPMAPAATVSCEKRGSELLQTGTVLVRNWSPVKA